MSVVNRETRETRIRIELSRLPGEGSVDTGEKFLDHMLVTLARYAGWTLKVSATGDLRHHLIEDVAIALGAALKAEIPRGAARFGERTIPMDDALVAAALDAGGRPYYQGPLPSSLYDHFMRSLCGEAGITLHLRVLRGRDRHHVIEAAFKALGMSLRQALAEAGPTMSTKGEVMIEVDKC